MIHLTETGYHAGRRLCLSDRADDAATVDFQQFLEQIARHYSGRIVRKALNLL